MPTLAFVSGAFPARLCAIFTDESTGAPLSEVPVFGHAIVSVTATAVPPGGPANRAMDIPLGTLASDHTGYLSFDLAPLERKLDDIVQAAAALGAPVKADVTNLWLHPYGPIPQSVDALAVQNVVDDAIVVRLAVGRQSVFVGDGMGFAAIQNPSLTDWYLSPASFSHLPAEIIGQDGCETMLPSNVATQAFSFAQVVPLDASFPITTRPGQPPLVPVRSAKRIAPYVSSQIASLISAQSPQFAPNLDPNWPGPRLAVAIAYDITWLPVGHGLGQVLYSLPLAPAEQVNIAIIDWARASTDQRAEQTSLSDTLVHDTTRDRTVGEVVDSSLSEWQRGGSLMGGSAVTGAFKLDSGTLGVADSMGGTYTTSSGNRDLSANSVQNIIDTFGQHSTAIRDLRSTVVMQSTASGSQNLQTRTVRNYNHSHALTILYYEVLRHYRVVVERGVILPAILLQELMPDFEEVAVFTYRRFLEPVLQMPELQPGFDAIEKLFAAESDPPPPPVPDPSLTTYFALFRIIVHVVGSAVKTDVFADIKDKNLNQVEQLLSVAARDQFLGRSEDFDRDGAFSNEVQGAPANGPVKWDAAAYLSLKFQTQDYTSSDKKVDLLVDFINVKAIDTNGVEHDLGSWGGSSHVFKAKMTESFPTIVLARPTPAPPPPTPMDQLTPDERHLRARLLAHLNSNKAFYYRQIWLGEDPNARYIRLRDLEISVYGTARKLFDVVENRVIDVVGDQLVMPLDPSLVNIPEQESPIQRELISIPLIAHARQERLISLPTRGVFAEAKLGHCNASEVIDNTRFWDWQKSPIPDNAPSISGISPVTPSAPANVTPTAFPTSLVAIQQPITEPDPVGLKAALDVLKTPGIFNDHSGVDDLKSLLTSLSDASARAAGVGGSTAAAAPGGATSGGSATPGAGKTPATPGGSGAMGGAATPGGSATPSGPAAPASPGSPSPSAPSAPAAPAMPTGPTTMGGGTTTTVAPLPAPLKAQGPKSKSFIFNFWGTDMEGDMQGSFTITAAAATGQQTLAGPDAPLVNGSLVGTGDLEGALNITVDGVQTFGPGGRWLPIGGVDDQKNYTIMGVSLRGSFATTPAAGQTQIGITVKKDVTYKGAIPVTRVANQEILPMLSQILNVPFVQFIFVNRTSAEPATPDGKVNELWEVYYATGNLSLTPS